MLARQLRITKKEDFEAVYRQGRKFPLGMIMLMVRSNSLKLTRFGVVVSAKFSKKAVERNRIKRQIRAIIEKNREDIKPGQDIVISARKTNTKTSHKSYEIEEVLAEILHKAKLINQKKN
jgi:ribonuclease P protein component